MSELEKPPVSHVPHDAPPPRRSNWTPVLLGCLGAMLLVLLMCGGVVWYVYSNAKRIATDSVRNAIVSMINSTELAEEEKEELVAEVDRVVNEYKAGNITLEQIGLIIEELGESPVLGAAVIFFAESKYVAKSGLSDEEKTAARRTLQRVARGIHEGQLQMDDLEGPMDIISRTGPDGERELKERVSDAELREFLGQLKQLADEAGVPDEEFKIDIGQAFREAVDRALAK